MNVVRTVIGREGDSGQQDMNVSALECGENSIEVLSCLTQRKTAKAVIAAELDKNDCRSKRNDRIQPHHRVFGGRAAGSHIFDLVAVAEFVEVTLQRVGVRLAGSKPIAGRNAIAKADKQWPVSREKRSSEKQNPERNDKAAAHVHKNSVAARGREQPAPPLRT